MASFTGKDPKDTYLSILQLNGDNAALQVAVPTIVEDAAGNLSLVELSQTTFGLTGILVADATGVTLGAGVDFEADAVTVDAVKDKTDDTVQILFTNGDPEGSLTANVGSIAMRRDGVAGATFYVKESGTGNTGWTTFDFIDTFTGLLDTPAVYVADKWVKVNAGGTALEFSDPPVSLVGAFTDLTDVPYGDYVGHAGKTVRIDPTETYLEFIAFPAGNFIGLTDTPGAYIANKMLQVNAGGTALEFIDPPSGSFVGHPDTPANYTGAAGQMLRVNSTPDAIEFADFVFIDMADTPGAYVADRYLRVNSAGNAVEFVTIDLGEGAYIDLSDTPVDYGSDGDIPYSNGVDAFEYQNINFFLFEKVENNPSPASDKALRYIDGTGIGWFDFDFTSLSDTPSDYTGQSRGLLGCNTGENSVEFYAANPGDGTLLRFNDTSGNWEAWDGTSADGSLIYMAFGKWEALSPGSDGQFLKLNVDTPEWVDLPDELPAGVQGEVLYYDGAAWVALGVGTDGNVLTTHGAAADPTWDAIPSSLPAGAKGEVLYHDGAAWDALGVGIPGQVLTTQGAGSNPQWVSGGGLPSGVLGDVLYNNGASWVVLNAGTSGLYLETKGGGAIPAWSDPIPAGVQGNVLYHNGADWVVLAPGTTGQVMTTNGGAANPAWADAPTELPSGVQGDIMYHNGSNWVVLGPGTAGYVLATQGAAANPTWAAAGVGGVTTFLGLTDAPASYSGQAGKVVAVNGVESAVEFVDLAVDYLDLGDTPATYTSDSAFGFPHVNAAEDGLEWPAVPLYEQAAYDPFTPVGIMAFIDADFGAWVPIPPPYPADDPAPRMYLVMDPSNDPNDIPGGPGIVGGQPQWDVVQISTGLVQNNNIGGADEFAVAWCMDTSGSPYDISVNYGMLYDLLASSDHMQAAPTDGQVLKYTTGGGVAWAAEGGAAPKYYDRVREPLTDGGASPELIFDSNGDVVMTETVTEYTTH